MSDNEKKNIEDTNLFDKLFREEMMEIDEDALLRSARNMFALYSSFIKAGFSEKRAFDLVTTTILPRSDN